MALQVRQQPGSGTPGGARRKVGALEPGSSPARDPEGPPTKEKKKKLVNRAAPGPPAHPATMNRMQGWKEELDRRIKEQERLNATGKGSGAGTSASQDKVAEEDALAALTNSLSEAFSGAPAPPPRSCCGADCTASVEVLLASGGRAPRERGQGARAGTGGARGAARACPSDPSAADVFSKALNPNGPARSPRADARAIGLSLQFCVSSTENSCACVRRSCPSFVFTRAAQ